MKNSELKEIWQQKNENNNKDKGVDFEHLETLRKKTSMWATRSLRGGIITDLLIKLLIICAFVFLVMLPGYDLRFKLIVTCVMLFIVVLIYNEFKVLFAHMDISGEETVIKNLKKHVNFLERKYRLFIFGSTFSAPLTFIAGSSIYYHLKYGEMKWGTPFSNPVMYGFILIAFLLGYLAQLPAYNLQRNTLNDILRDLDPEEEVMVRTRTLKQRRINLLLIFVGLICLGLLMLLMNQ